MASTRTTRRTVARITRASFTRLPGSLKPFKRAIELHKQFIDTLASLADALPTDRQIAIEALPPYVSRGHGGRHRPNQRLVDGHQMRDRSKYDPRAEDVKHLRRPSAVTVKRAPRPRGYEEGLYFAERLAAKTEHDAGAV